jgi:hypothetical protein
MTTAAEALRELLKYPFDIRGKWKPVWDNARAALAAHDAQQQEPPIVEVWHGNRKVTVYPDAVLRVWGPTFDQITDEPRSLHTVNAAFDWLYETAAQQQEPQEPRP